MQKIVIIGASHAGLSCAERLRHHGFEGQITIYDREAGWPLQRPPLSKTYLKAATDSTDDSFLLRKADWFDVFNIDFRPACTVTTLHPETAEITLADGRKIGYDQLVLATGATARHMPVKGGDAAGVFVLRVPEDARAIRKDLENVKRAVVVGGGYIGLEAAASLRALDIQVDIIEMAPRLLARVASEPLSDYCAQLHQKMGTTIHLGAGVDEIICDEEGRCCGVLLADGTVIKTDIVLAGIGVIPDIELAQRADLEIGNGIVVSENYQTRYPNIWAIGDVAHAPDISPMRIESIHHAQYSASVVAACLMSVPKPEPEAWWFWSDQYDVKFQMAGILPVSSAPELQSVVRKGRREASQSVWSWYQGQLVCVEAANDGQAYMIGKKCLEEGKNPQADEIANSEFVLKSLLG